MVLQNGEINIIADMEGTTGVKLHNNRQKLRSRFDIVKKLGQGTYGKVQLAINKDTGEEVAIKTIKKSKIETEQDLVRIQREIQIMSSVQHPSIIHIYEVFENREKIVLVMEYASGGELYDYISYKKVLDEMEARRVFRQVAAAVFYCHKNMICHRDLKLENILLDERGCAKIADFGLSNVFDERNFLSTFCGSPLYASPEIVRGTPYYGPEVDCWSLGVLLYTLVYGAMPFDGSNFKKLVRQISEGDYYEPKAPSEASHLIRRMLTVDPAKRANIDDICCDVWVDMGEDTPLYEIAEEMCKQMPVRLDYLLTLSSAAASPSEPCAELPIPPSLLPQSSQTANQEEEDADQWERPALQGSRAEMMTNDATATVRNSAAGMSTNQEETHDAKKHKLVTSSSTLADIQKKKKRDDDGDLVDELNGVENEIGAAEVVKENAEPVSAVADPSESIVSDTGNNELLEANVSSDQNAGEATVVSAMDTDKVVSTADDSPTTFVRDSSPVKKRLSSIKRASLTSASKLNKSISEVATNQTDTGTAKATCNGGLSATNKGGIRLKKSTTGVGSKDGIGGTGDATADKRKLSFGSLRPVNEAKRAFEAKTTSTTAEIKPVIAVGKKVLSARKAFESPPTTPEVSKIVRPPLTKKVSDEGKPVKQDDASETAASDSKRTLVRQGSRKFGVPRATVSPTKTVRSQQHQGCVPHEAKVAAAAAAADETKKTSTVSAKTVICRRSPPTPGTSSESPTRKTSLTKAPSFTKLASAPRRTSAPGSSTNSRSVISNSTIRPKSPVKTVKDRSNVTDSAPSGLPVARSEPEASGEQKPAGDQAVDAESSVDSLTKKIKAVHVSDSVLESPQLGKRGSIDIAPLPQPVLEESSPQISFVPRDKCQFTLVGVKSEVMFDVDDANCEPEVVETRDEEDRSTAEKARAEEQNQDEGDNSKIIRYVATVRRHGSEDTSDPGPERVTLLNIRRSETGMSDASKDCETPDSGVADQTERDHQASPLSMSTKAETNVQSNRYRQVSRTADGVLEERKAQVNESSVNTEQRGYSVYRSKYRSVQKYRSVVERRNSERSTAAIQEGAGDDECDVPAGAIGESSSNNVEHSDSFSSAGSTDELEDVFESLTSESLFTSLLNRTRNLIERIANDGDAHSSPFFQSSFLGRRFLGGPQSVTSNSAAMSLLLNPPTISFRRNPLNHAGYNYTDPVSRSETRSPESDLGMRRWLPSRSSVREESKPSAFSGGNIRLRARASFNSNDYSSSSGGVGLTDSLSNRRHQSRYETFRSQEDSMTSSIADSANRRREEARSDIISALLRHRNRSLDGRRPRSLYGGSDEYLSTKSASPHDSNYQRGQDSYLDEERHDVTMTNANDKASNLYGTIRRPNRFPRYTKSMTKEVNADEYDSSRSLRDRPRSIHEILSNNLDVNINGGGDHDDEDSAATSVSRDYSKSGSKSVSRTGATKREEEEEFEREHRVTEDAVGGRSVTTTERQVSRSISQTEDDKSCSSSSVHVHTSSTLLQRRPAVNKKLSSDGDDGISRQDSGVGSLYDSVSQPSTTQSGIRRGGGGGGGGVLSNDLGSLENEMSRIGLRRHQQQESAKPYGGEADSGEQMSGGASKTDGATTPASDSADTGSVCSDASGTATETSSSTMKATEEESVGERIRRKSFFARFNDTTARAPRKVRKPSTGSMSSSSAAATSSLRSDLSRSSSLRHRIFDDDAFTSRLHYDSPPDFYGTASRYNPQRWSMHPGNSGDPDFLAYEAGVPLSPRRSSFQSGDHLSYLRRPASGSWVEDNSSAENNVPHPPCWRATSPMSRTHSLPEEVSGVDGSDPRAMHRQTSVPGNAAGIPPASPARRPSHLGLYSTHFNPGHCEEADEWLSPESPSSSIRANSWSRPSTSSSGHQRPRMNSASRDQPPPPESHRRMTASSLASSLMDNLDSPSEVLQKAMDLCDSLRYT